METKVAVKQETLADCSTNASQYCKELLVSPLPKSQQEKNFMRLASLPVRPTHIGGARDKSVSLLQHQRRKESLITIHFFEDDYHMTFDLDEFETSTKVREFILTCVENYCLENYEFVPDNINYRTFQLKLADLQNRHDPLIDPIDYEEEIDCYKQCNLCLVRKEPQNSNLAVYQQTLPESDIFQVYVHVLKPAVCAGCCFKLPIGSLFSDLKARVISTCSLQQIESSCLFVDYKTFKICADNQLTSSVRSRKFELIRAREKDYADQPIVPAELIPKETHSHDKYRAKTEAKLMSDKELKNILSEDSLTVQVEGGILKGRMSISVEHADFIQRIEQSHVSKIVGLVWEQDLQKTYPLAALITIEAENDSVSLVFRVRGKTVRKDYKLMDSYTCKKFVAEVLRRCRLLKRRLSDSSKSP